jgi:hypothetical protein
MPMLHRDFFWRAALFMGLAGYALAAALAWTATG